MALPSDAAVSFGAGTLLHAVDAADDFMLSLETGPKMMIVIS